MKTFFFALASVLSSLSIYAQGGWTIDYAHSGIKFSVTHMMVSEVDGNFKKFTGTITSTKDDLSDAQIEITIDATSINTDNENRDKHLKGEDFFNVDKYPNILFKSTSLKKVGDNKYVLE